MEKAKLWSSRSISYERRVIFINSVLFCMYNCWASIFILPQDVIDQVTKTCRNYIQGGDADYKRIPYISLQLTWIAISMGGCASKTLILRNIASIPKLIQVTALKKDRLRSSRFMEDILSIEHGGTTLHLRIQVGTRRNYTMLKINSKEVARTSTIGSKGAQKLQTIKSSYLWYLNCIARYKWSKVVQSRANIPRHAFIS